MFLFMIGLVVMISLLIISSIVLTIIEGMSNHRDVRRDRVRVMATVIDVQMKQDWRYCEEWERDVWSGDLKRKRTWQTYYDVAAQWVHPQTGHLYTSRIHIWSNGCTSKPVKGDSGAVWFDPHNLEWSCLDPQSARNPLLAEAC